MIKKTWKRRVTTVLTQKQLELIQAVASPNQVLLNLAPVEYRGPDQTETILLVTEVVIYPELDSQKQYLIDGYLKDFEADGF